MQSTCISFMLVQPFIQSAVLKQGVNNTAVCTLWYSSTHISKTVITAVDVAVIKAKVFLHGPLSTVTTWQTGDRSEQEWGNEGERGARRARNAVTGGFQSFSRSTNRRGSWSGMKPTVLWAQEHKLLHHIIIIDLNCCICLCAAAVVWRFQFSNTRIAHTTTNK